jgi:hypothetical protein
VLGVCGGVYVCGCMGVFGWAHNEYHHSCMHGFLLSVLLFLPCCLDASFVPPPLSCSHLGEDAEEHAADGNVD